MASTALTQPGPAPAPAFDEEDAIATQVSGQWSLVWRRFRRHRLGLISLVVLAALIAACVLAPWVAPYPFDKQDPLLINRFPGPSAAHWLGTDELGRDVLSRLLYAGRVSLFVSLIATVVSIVIGVAIGAIAAYFGGW